MARRPGGHGDAMIRKCLAENCRWFTDWFPTPRGRDRLASIECGEALYVSGEELFQSLFRGGYQDAAEEFVRDNRRYVLSETDVLSEVVDE